METHKQRIIQEFVPGKQVTLAHLIANPEPSIYKNWESSVSTLVLWAS